MQPKTPIIYANYKILSAPKSGAYGHVYEAENMTLREKVALKFIKDASDRDNYERFKLENVILHKLNPHDNIITPRSNTVYDGVNAFYSMEYLELDIEALLPNIPSDDVRAKIKLSIEICEGLYHAHQKKIFHRDLHPGNIRVESVLKSTPKLSDFGLSKMQGARLVSRAPLLAWGGGIIPPEVALFVTDTPDEDFFIRGDIYALGLVTNFIFSGSNIDYAVAIKQSVSDVIQKSNLAWPDDYMAMPIAERKRIYGEWLKGYDPSWANLLNIYTTKVSLGKKISEIIKKMCNVDPKMRYDSVDSIITELKGL